MTRDIDNYGKPYVWTITLEDFLEDDRERDEDGEVICPKFPQGRCGHPYSYCIKCRKAEK